MAIEISDIQVQGNQVGFVGTKNDVPFRFCVTEEALNDLAHYRAADAHEPLDRLAVFEDHEAAIILAAEKVIDYPDRNNSGLYILSSHHVCR